jgi:hypothetical protein
MSAHHRSYGCLFHLLHIRDFVRMRGVPLVVLGRPCGETMCAGVGEIRKSISGTKLGSPTLHYHVSLATETGIYHAIRMSYHLLAPPSNRMKWEFLTCWPTSLPFLRRSSASSSFDPQSAQVRIDIPLYLSVSIPSLSPPVSSSTSVKASAALNSGL